MYPERRLRGCPICGVGLDELHARDCCYAGMFRGAVLPVRPMRGKLLLVLATDTVRPQPPEGRYVALGVALTAVVALGTTWGLFMGLKALARALGAL